MRVLSIIWILTITLTCAAQLDSNQIIGSWKLQNVIDSTKMKSINKITFDKSDFVTLDMFYDGKLCTQIKGKYKFDSKKATLTTVYEDGTFKFRIITLTNRELELENLITRKIKRYTRCLEE